DGGGATRAAVRHKEAEGRRPGDGVFVSGRRRRQVIQLESIHIEWARGIAQKLDLHFQRKSFAISGPNGSGKSAVIDAVEFALTGKIGRLEGTGTKGLSIAEHGPHVDKAKFPDAA